DWSKGTQAAPRAGRSPGGRAAPRAGQSSGGQAAPRAGQSSGGQAAPRAGQSSGGRAAPMAGQSSGGRVALMAGQSSGEQALAGQSSSLVKSLNIEFQELSTSQVEDLNTSPRTAACPDWRRHLGEQSTLAETDLSGRIYGRGG
ncbi:hypothetical protein LDENG_00013060, partial [Lucifuga dentata]